MAEIKGTLERRKGSKWWYGCYRTDGKRKAVNLRIEIRGAPPAPDQEYGSIQYEKSRSEAQAAMQAHLRELNSNRKTEDFAQAVHEARTGRRVDAYLLEDLPRLWKEKPRSKPVSESHRKTCTSYIEGFQAWCAEHFPAVTKLEHISPDIARAFLDWHEARGITARTWNFILGTLKTACRRGGCIAFDEIPQKPLETVHRVPFTPDELADVLESARSDKLLYPLVVTAACTAMRKGDCCRLRWKDVDLIGGYITVKTSKTGRTVDIPLADLLKQEIEKQRRGKSEYVFPKLEKQYTANSILLTKRFKNILSDAGFHDGKAPPAKLAPYDPQELAEKAETYFQNIPTDQKRNKARAMFEHYTGGKPLCRSAEQVGISKSTASAYLNEIETKTGIAFIRGKKRPSQTALPPSRGRVRIERPDGLKQASVRDFHALRTTWITLALMSGMPLELVQTVTGHATAEIVMQHYFKPQREQLRSAMQKALPGLLASTPASLTPTDKAVEILEKVNQKNWKKKCAEAVAILKGSG